MTGLLRLIVGLSLGLLLGCSQLRLTVPLGVRPAQVVTVTGVGATLQAAKEDAIRIALGRVLGAYVTAHLKMRNDRILRDEVLSHSAGFVQEARVLAERLRPDGLHEVTLTARVATQGVEHWERARGTTQALSGNGLFAEAYSKLQRDQTALSLWYDLLMRFPAQALTARVVGRPRVGIDARDPKRAALRIAVRVEWQPGFLDDVRLLLEQTGTPLGGFFHRNTRNIPALCVPSLLGPRCYEIDRRIGNLIDHSLAIPPLCWGPQHIPALGVSVVGATLDGRRSRLGSAVVGTELVSGNCIRRYLRGGRTETEIVARVTVADLQKLTHLEAEIDATTSHRNPHRTENL